MPVNRSNEALNDNQGYVTSAVALVDEILRFHNIRRGTKILDFGCGQGRLAIGLIFSGVSGYQYVGIDTHKDSVNWCDEWISSQSNSHEFHHLATHNTRYNPQATELLKLPEYFSGFDLIFLNSVFSHMLASDIRFYLSEFKRVLNPGGIIYMTAFIDENVENETENPTDFHGRSFIGPLHRVVFEKRYFLKMLEDEGFVVVKFEHQAIERTLQSVIVATS